VATTMSKAPTRTLIAVGIACLLMAAAGIWYNSEYLTVDYSETLETQSAENPEIKGDDLSDFYTVFYVLSGICISFYIILAITGIQLIRLKISWVFVLLGIVVAEVVYYIVLGRLWGLPQYGRSIAAATGVSSGGLVFQGLSLFPIWAPLAALWARNRIRKESEANDL